jgi:hypothetical protein
VDNLETPAAEPEAAPAGVVPGADPNALATPPAAPDHPILSDPRFSGDWNKVGDSYGELEKVKGSLGEKVGNLESQNQLLMNQLAMANQIGAMAQPGAQPAGPPDFEAQYAENERQLEAGEINEAKAKMIEREIDRDRISYEIAQGAREQARELQAKQADNAFMQANPEFMAMSHPGGPISQAIMSDPVLAQMAIADPRAASILAFNNIKNAQARQEWEGQRAELEGRLATATEEGKKQALNEWGNISKGSKVQDGVLPGTGSPIGDVNPQGNEPKSMDEVRAEAAKVLGDNW